jgi:RNA polymerase sigma factor (sigma-70 family)
MPERTDDALIQAIAQGDSESLHVLYARYGLELLNYLLGRIPDRRTAEDVLQAVMLAVWQSAGRFRAESSVRTWLYAITRRRLADTWRTLPPDSVPIDDLDLPTDSRTQLDQDAERDALMQAIALLPADQQEALELFFFRGLSIAQAAEKTGVNINTFKSKLHRAKQTLRQLLQEI